MTFRLSHFIVSIRPLFGIAFCRSVCDGPAAERSAVTSLSVACVVYKKEWEVTTELPAIRENQHRGLCRFSRIQIGK